MLVVKVTEKKISPFRTVKLFRSFSTAGCYTCCFGLGIIEEEKKKEIFFFFKSRKQKQTTYQSPPPQKKKQTQKSEK